MKQNQKRTRRLFLVLLILLLASLSYLGLEYTTYIGGGWQTVQGQGLISTSKSPTPFSVEVPARSSFKKADWKIVREGQLFFKPLPVVEEAVVDDLPLIIEETGPVLPEIISVEPPKPTCPLMVAGVMLGKEPTAILVNKTTQMSQTVAIGSFAGDFEVVEIQKSFVLVRSSEADFKLELGGM